MKLLCAIPVILCLAFSSAAAAGPPAGERELSGKLSGDVRVSGAVLIAEDLIVLPGATLTAAPGTVFTFGRKENTKVDPQHFFGGVELVVRGDLVADRAEFRFSERSGGIVVDGGRATLSGCSVSGAEAGVTAIRGGIVSVSGLLSLTDCRVGAAIYPGGRFRTELGGRINATRNSVGVFRLPPSAEKLGLFDAAGNEEADIVAWEDESVPPSPPPFPTVSASATRMGDTFLDRDRTLSGDVIVEGIIRVAPGVRLTISPGSRLFFTFRDTDGDGIGENGLFLQGTLSAEGTTEREIGFYPYDGSGYGRWDSINFMASDQEKNVVANAVIAGAYRGLHAHFSKLEARDLRIRDCFRGMQFQESEVLLSGVSVSRAANALRARDATVKIDGLKIRDVASAVNFFRSSVDLRRFSLERTGWYGFRFRDSEVTVSDGRVAVSLVGISVQEGRVRMSGVSVFDAGLAGYSLMDGDIGMEGCRSVGSQVDAMSAVKAKGKISGGELSGYGRHAVRLTGPAQLVLSGVKVAPAAAGKRQIQDGTVVPGLGTVRVE